MSRVVEYHVITVPLSEDREVKMSEFIYILYVFLFKCVIQVCPWNESIIQNADWDGLKMKNNSWQTTFNGLAQP